jgi:hypothetical protein
METFFVYHSYAQKVATTSVKRNKQHVQKGATTHVKRSNNKCEKNNKTRKEEQQ